MDSTVFVVDDDQAVRDAITFLLEWENLAVESHGSAEAFLQAYDPERPGCLVLDINMPGMSGLELQEVLHDKHIRIPIIFITAHGDVSMSVRALKAGAVDFIEKPFDNEILLDRVQEAIAWDLRIRDEEAKRIADATRIYAESIVETVREPLLVLDEDLCIVSANRSFYDTFQIRGEQADKELYSEFRQHLWEVPTLHERMATIIRDRVELRGFEITYEFPRIGRRTMLLNAQRLRQRGDQPDRVLLAMEDITERKRAEEGLQSTTRAIAELYAIVSAVTQPFDERVRALLELGRRYFGLNTGILARVIEERYEVIEVVSEDTKIEKGAVFPLGETYCKNTLQAAGPIGFENAAKSKWASHPVYNQCQLNAYIGVPILVQGSVYGTLNFSSAVPRQEKFTQADNDFLQLMATWISEELERKRSEGRSRAFLESAPDAMVVVNRHGKITLVNEQTEALFGYRREELIGQELECLVPERFRNAHYRQRDGYTRHPKLRAMDIGLELFGRRKDGTEIPVDISLSHYESDEGRYVVSAIRDITERKQADEALFQEKERAQVTLHSIGDAVITTDSTGRVEYLNPIAEQLTGWTVTEACGQPISTVFSTIDERSRTPTTDPVSRCLEQGRTVALEGHAVLVGRHGQEYGIEDTAAPIRNRKGAILGTVMVFRDVTEQRRVARELAHRAIHDPLTGLVNRREFEKRLDNAIAGNKAHRAPHALCYLDLDQFKIVNDTAGHAAGDELLRQVTAAFTDKLRDRDTLARLGGDEFGLLLNNCPLDKALEIAETLVSEIRHFRFVWEGRPFQIGTSIGLVPIIAEVESAEALLNQADIACYTAKRLGRNRVHIYRTEDTKPAQRPSEMVRAADLSRALDEDRFILYGQPIVSLLPGRDEVVRYELLVRLLDDNGEIVLPGAFIPAAERHGMMSAVDRWVIEHACGHFIDVVETLPNTEIAINLSGISLGEESFLAFVRKQLTESVVRPDQICFEITELSAIQNFTQAHRFINELKKEGCRFALDDFGGGLSSFQYLKKLPVDYLKIEGSFVRSILESPLDHAMVDAISRIAHSLGIQIIAKDAESDAVITKLRELGVDYAQGYALCSPAPLEQLAA